MAIRRQNLVIGGLCTMFALLAASFPMMLIRRQVRGGKNTLGAVAGRSADKRAVPQGSLSSRDEPLAPHAQMRGMYLNTGSRDVGAWGSRGRWEPFHGRADFGALRPRSDAPPGAIRPLRAAPGAGRDIAYDWDKQVRREDAE